MDRADIPYSRLLAGAIVMAAGIVAGCERQDAITYDPQIDGIKTPALAAADLSILEDQKSRHPAATPVRPPAPPRPAPVTAPAATQNTPPPPAEEGAPPPPPPDTAPATAPDAAPATAPVPEAG